MMKLHQELEIQILNIKRCFKIHLVFSLSDLVFKSWWGWGVGGEGIYSAISYPQIYVNV